MGAHPDHTRHSAFATTGEGRSAAPDFGQQERDQRRPSRCRNGRVTGSMARRVLLQRIGYVSRRQERNRTLHEIFLWQGLELLIRSDSVDRAELEWMAGSSLWQAFEAAEVSPDDVVLDLGAHIGSFALLAASRRQCMVVGFEPDQESLRLCRINISLNALENRIVCHRFAI